MGRHRSNDDRLFRSIFEPRDFAVVVWSRRGSSRSSYQSLVSLSFEGLKWYALLTCCPQYPRRCERRLVKVTSVLRSAAMREKTAHRKFMSCDRYQMAA